MSKTTFEGYVPSLKERHEATIVSGKAIESKGGSIRYMLQGEYNGRKTLPKTVSKADFESVYGFDAKEAEAVYIKGNKEYGGVKFPQAIYHQVGKEDEEGFETTEIIPIENKDDASRVISREMHKDGRIIHNVLPKRADTVGNPSPASVEPPAPSESPFPQEPSNENFSAFGFGKDEEEESEEPKTKEYTVVLQEGDKLELTDIAEEEQVAPDDENTEKEAESNQDIKWSDVKEMGNSKCPFCFRSAFRLLDEEGEEFSVYEENLAGDNWLLECSRCKAEWNQYGENTLDGGYTGNAESRFDKLSNEIADEYEEKGMSPEKAQEVGDATAAMIGRKKYGKKGMAKMQREGMNAEGFTDINYDAKIRLNNPKDAKYITPSIEDGMDFENGEGVLSSKSKIDLNAEGDSATYSPSDEPDMVNEIQTSPTNESPQLFNASNTFNTTTALGIGGLVVAALSLPMLYSSAKSRLGKSAEEKRKSNGSVRKNHTQVKNSEYSVGQVNPVEAEGQQDIHGAEGITNPRHSPSPTPSGYPSKNLKMW